MSSDATESAQKTQVSPELPEPEPPSRPERKAGAADRPPERAAFLDGFPSDPDLDALVAAFVRGNYARVRAEAPKLAERALDDRVRAAALELRRRIEPDPLARYVLFASIALLVVLALIAYVSHAGHAQ